MGTILFINRVVVPCHPTMGYQYGLFFFEVDCNMQLLTWVLVIAAAYFLYTHVFDDDSRAEHFRSFDVVPFLKEDAPVVESGKLQGPDAKIAITTHEPVQVPATTVTADGNLETPLDPKDKPLAPVIPALLPMM